MKICSLCKIEKSLPEFTKDKNGRDGLKSGCRSCLTAQKRAARHRNPTPNREACKRWAKKNPEKRKEYEKRYRGKIPPEVRKARRLRWLANNPGREKFLGRRSHLKKYGLSPQDYDRLEAAQGGACAICGEVTARRLFVDHCHKTGKIRELLCSGCNFGLGAFKESPELFEKAKNYVSKHTGA